MLRRLRLMSSLLLVCSGMGLVAQGGGTVRVTVARANIRAEANETAKVLTQVTQNAILDLVSIEGDWFKVRVSEGPVRFEAYISKKVSKLETPPPAAPAPPANTPPPPPPPPPTTRDSMQVLITIGKFTNPLVPKSTRIVQVADKVDSLAKAAGAIPAADAPPPAATGSGQVSYVWIADGAAAEKVVEDRRPSFVAFYKEIPGLSPDDLGVALVRLTPAPSGVRLVCAARGRADQAKHTDTDWDVMKDLKQDVIKAQVEPVDRGGVRVTPYSDLAPGEYAIVVRPTGKKKLAGADVLSTTGEGRVFGVYWEFAVK